MTVDLIIAGGINDPNLGHLIDITAGKNISVRTFLVDEDSSPSFYWDMGEDAFPCSDGNIVPSALFFRRNVFHSSDVKAHDRALAWYTALMGWVAVHPEVRILNRARLWHNTNKPWVLELASSIGMTVPKTFVTNDLDRLGSIGQGLVAKPVAGGGYCHDLDSIVDDTEVRSGLTASPAIVQQRVEGDDVRIFRIGQQYFGFRITSNDIDYRRSSDHDIAVLVDLPEGTIRRLSNLMDGLGMDWGAADFKICSRTAQWFFLEVNSNPMFSVFDRKAEGNISDAILQFLLHTDSAE